MKQRKELYTNFQREYIYDFTMLITFLFLSTKTMLKWDFYARPYDNARSLGSPYEDGSKSAQGRLNREYTNERRIPPIPIGVCVVPNVF